MRWFSSYGENIRNSGNAEIPVYGGHEIHKGIKIVMKLTVGHRQQNKKAIEFLNH